MVDRQDLRGIYNVEYFSGSQAAIYIGDTWIDEITSFGYEVSNRRSPIFGYASQLYDAVSEGQILVQGQFSINFKEAGYLFLVLDRYQKFFNSSYRSSLIPAGNTVDRPNVYTTNEQNIEKIIQGETNIFTRNEALQNLVTVLSQDKNINEIENINDRLNTIGSNAAGFASSSRAVPEGISTAENMQEIFEDKIWGSPAGDKSLDNETRRADDPKLNPFDIYLVYGDYIGSNLPNHTVRKLSDVVIVGSAQQIVSDGQPLQEVYSFIARNIV